MDKTSRRSRVVGLAFRGWSFGYLTELCVGLFLGFGGYNSEVRVLVIARI